MRQQAHTRVPSRDDDFKAGVCWELGSGFEGHQGTLPNAQKWVGRPCCFFMFSKPESHTLKKETQNLIWVWVKRKPPGDRRF